MVIRRFAQLALVSLALIVAWPSPARSGPEEDRRTADEIVADSKKAGERGEKLAKAVREGDEAVARSMVGVEVIVGGKPVQRSKEQWTLKSPWGATIVATKINGEADPNVEIEESSCCAWGKVKSVDMKTKTITLEDTEMVYVEKINWPKGK